MKTEYKTKNYNANVFVFTLLPMTFVAIALMFLILFLLKAPPTFFGIGYACILVPILIFAKQLRTLFTHYMLLEFDEEAFSVTQYDAKNVKVQKHLVIPWSEIKQYKVYFTSKDYTIITLYLRNGKTKSWNFNDKKSMEDAIRWDSLFKTFFTHVKQYNVGKDEAAKITLNKGFFNSKVGTKVIYCEIGLIVFAFILHVALHAQSSFVTLLVGAGFTIQQYYKRKEEQKTYDRISSLE